MVFLGTDFILTMERISLVTQPILQRRPNRTELRSMDSYIQIHAISSYKDHSKFLSSNGPYIFPKFY